MIAAEEKKAKMQQSVKLKSKKIGRPPKFPVEISSDSYRCW